MNNSVTFTFTRCYHLFVNKLLNWERNGAPTRHAKVVSISRCYFSALKFRLTWTLCSQAKSLVSYLCLPKTIKIWQSFQNKRAKNWVGSPHILHNAPAILTMSIHLAPRHRLIGEKSWILPSSHHFSQSEVADEGDASEFQYHTHSMSDN